MNGTCGIRDAATSGKAETSESDVPLACGATPSRSRRNDMDEDTAAATARKRMTPQRPEQRSEVPENRGPQRNKDCGWRLWWYASSFKPPRSPAGASHNIHHEVNNHSLCALIHHDRDDPLISRWRGFFHLPGQLRTGGGPPHEPFDKGSAWIFYAE